MRKNRKIQKESEASSSQGEQQSSQTTEQRMF